MVDGIKDVSERIQFGSLILKNSGDMAARSATSSTSSMPKVQLNTFIASLRSEILPINSVSDEEQPRPQRP